MLGTIAVLIVLVSNLIILGFGLIEYFCNNYYNKFSKLEVAIMCVLWVLSAVGIGYNIIPLLESLLEVLK